MVGPVALTVSERQLIRSALVELARACSTVVLYSLENPSAASAVASWISSPTNFESNFGPKLFKSACNSIALSTAAASDNLNTFVFSLRNERSAVSMAALTRATLEAYGRAYFLLQSQSAEGFFHRYVSLTHDELKYPVRHSGFTTAEGAVIDGAAYRAELTEFAKKLNSSKLLDVSLAELVATLLAQAADGETDPAIYSQLSGAAHAAASAVGMFVQRSMAGWGLTLPSDIAFEYAGYIYAAATVVGDRAVELFDPPVAVADRWRGARDRATLKMLELRSAL
jgi:hypothetical protein